jgi:iron complex outermembrane receptor protein
VDEDNTSPKLAVTLEPREGTILTARFGRAYRFPTNPEYYWWYSGFQPPARDGLTSEKATQYELEIERRMNEDFSVVARGYYYDVDDYLRTIFGYMPSRVVYNIHRVELTGLELEIVYRVTPRLRVWGTFTRQNTEKHGDILDGSAALTDELTELPDDKGTLGVSYSHERGFEMELAARYTGDKETVRGNPAVPGGSFLAETDAYLNLALRMSWPLYRNEKGVDVRMKIAGENLLDEDIEEEYGYPLPGRTVTASLTAAF